jgi:hypothetical protein
MKNKKPGLQTHPISAFIEIFINKQKPSGEVRFFLSLLFFN